MYRGSRRREEDVWTSRTRASTDVSNGHGTGDAPKPRPAPGTTRLRLLPYLVLLCKKNITKKDEIKPLLI